MRTLDDIAKEYSEQAVVNFIYNRHCSRFNPQETSLHQAIDIAWSYKTEEYEIVDDWSTVELYQDLDQYTR